MKICELMKNHIKNYIKIPRPATVPFETESEVTTIRAAKEKVKGRYEGIRIIMSQENEKGEWLKSVKILRPYRGEILVRS